MVIQTEQAGRMAKTVDQASAHPGNAVSVGILQHRITVMNDGRVMYLRWDYTDTPHIFIRMLFTMNPDGTEQAEYYGSNSYWPNSTRTTPTSI